MDDPRSPEPGTSNRGGATPSSDGRDLTEPYSVLAPYYDVLMQDVDYEAWADYLDEIIQLHHPEAVHVHEIACGTGSMALSIEGMGCYTVSGSDRSTHMVHIALGKARRMGKSVSFERQDFRDLNLELPVDVIYCVFDSVNYLLNESGVENLFESVCRNLKEDGLLVFDFTTPSHSLEAAGRLNGEIMDLQADRFAIRSSRYEQRTMLHRNEFRFFEPVRSDDGGRVPTFPPLPRLAERFRSEGYSAIDPTRYVEFRPSELHVQKAYGWWEMLDIVRRSGLELESAYEEFTLDPANERSNRITMVCRCKTTT